MQRLEVSGAVRPIYGSLGVKRVIRVNMKNLKSCKYFCFSVLYIQPDDGRLACRNMYTLLIKIYKNKVVFIPKTLHHSNEGIV